MDILLTAATCGIGVCLLSVGCSGYPFAPIGLVVRAPFIVAGFALFPAPNSTLFLAGNLSGLALGTLLIFFLWMQRRRASVLT